MLCYQITSLYNEEWYLAKGAALIRQKVVESVNVNLCLDAHIVVDNRKENPWAA